MVGPEDTRFPVHCSEGAVQAQQPETAGAGESHGAGPQLCCGGSRPCRQPTSSVQGAAARGLSPHRAPGVHPRPHHLCQPLGLAALSLLPRTGLLLPLVSSGNLVGC